MKNAKKISAEGTPPPETQLPRRLYILSYGA